MSESIVDVSKHIDMLELEAKEGSNGDSILKSVTELAQLHNQLEYAKGKEAKLVARVNNDLLNIRLTVPANASTWSPIGDALDDFSDEFIYALSDVISFCAMIIPWLPVIVFLMLLLRLVWNFFRPLKS